MNVLRNVIAYVRNGETLTLEFPPPYVPSLPGLTLCNAMLRVVTDNRGRRLVLKRWRALVRTTLSISLAVVFRLCDRAMTIPTRCPRRLGKRSTVGDRVLTIIVDAPR